MPFNVEIKNDLENPPAVLVDITETTHDGIITQRNEKRKYLSIQALRDGVGRERFWRKLEMFSAVALTSSGFMVVGTSIFKLDINPELRLALAGLGLATSIAGIITNLDSSIHLKWANAIYDKYKKTHLEVGQPLSDSQIPAES